MTPSIVEKVDMTDNINPLEAGGDGTPSPAVVEIPSNTRGVKRPAEDEVLDDSNSSKGTQEPTLSKNQLRKLRRKEKWIERKPLKKAMRKEKRHRKVEEKRRKIATELETAAAEGRDPILPDQPKRQPQSRTQVPISVVFDCQYEEYMTDKELASLASQITRSYSDNKNTQFPVHMFVSSYGGELKKRFETVLENQNKKWKNVHFVEGDFVEAAAQAKDLMKGPKGGEIIDLIAPRETDSLYLTGAEASEAEDVDKSIVYLSSDSPYSLERPEPGTTYVIGGLIDRNRQKGLCYKVACEKKVRTAKLPINDYMILHTRHILASNHVMEILLAWLETGDWGTAFMRAVPSRKGGKLKGAEEGSGEVAQDDEVKNDVATTDDSKAIEAAEPTLEQHTPGIVEVEVDSSEKI